MAEKVVISEINPNLHFEMRSMDDIAILTVNEAIEKFINSPNTSERLQKYVREYPGRDPGTRTLLHPHVAIRRFLR
ncbi:MAG: hypothetical protein PQJ35_01690 [Sphaerochaetaceae bacterium]|nr:hypothetical protein [Sphaerochaetaceae bacterium]